MAEKMGHTKAELNAMMKRSRQAQRATVAFEIKYGRKATMERAARIWKNKIVDSDWVSEAEIKAAPKAKK